MENLSLLRKRRSLAVLLVLAVLVTYSLPMSIFADTGEPKIKQDPAEIVVGDGESKDAKTETTIYKKDGSKITLAEGETFEDKDDAVVSVTKKITKVPDAPNKFDVTTEIKTKPEVEKNYEPEDAALLLTCFVGHSFDASLFHYGKSWEYFKEFAEDSEADPKAGLEKFRNKLREELKADPEAKSKEYKEALKKNDLFSFVDKYAKNGKGKKRLLSLIIYDGTAKVDTYWADLSKPEEMNEFIIKFMSIHEYALARMGTLGTNEHMDGYEHKGGNLEGALKLSSHCMKADELKDIKEEQRHVLLMLPKRPSSCAVGGVQGEGEGAFVQGGLMSRLNLLAKVEGKVEPHFVKYKPADFHIVNEIDVDDLPANLAELKGAAKKIHTILNLRAYDPLMPMRIYKQDFVFSVSNTTNITGGYATWEFAKYLEENKDKVFQATLDKGESGYRYLNLPKGVVSDCYLDQFPHRTQPNLQFSEYFYWETDEKEKYKSDLDKEIKSDVYPDIKYGGTYVEKWYKEYLGLEPYVIGDQKRTKFQTTMHNRYEKKFAEIEREINVISDEPSDKGQLKIEEAGSKYFDLEGAGTEDYSEAKGFKIQPNISVTKEDGVTVYKYKYFMNLKTSESGFEEGKEYGLFADTSKITYRVPNAASERGYDEHTVKLPELKVKGYKPLVPFNVKYHFVDRNGVHKTPIVFTPTPNYVKSGTTVVLGNKPEGAAEDGTLYIEGDYATKYSAVGAVEPKKKYNFKQAQTNTQVKLEQDKGKVTLSDGTVKSGSGLYTLDVFYKEEPVNVNVEYHLQGTVIDEDGNFVKYEGDDFYIDTALNKNSVGNDANVLVPASEKYYVGDDVTAVTEGKFGSDARFTGIKFGSTTKDRANVTLGDGDNTIKCYYKGTYDKRNKVNIEVRKQYVHYGYEKNAQGIYEKKKLAPEPKPQTLVTLGDVWVVNNSAPISLDLEKIDKNLLAAGSGYTIEKCEKVNDDNSVLGTIDSTKETDDKGKQKLNASFADPKHGKGDKNVFLITIAQTDPEPELANVTINHRYTLYKPEIKDNRMQMIPKSVEVVSQKDLKVHIGEPLVVTKQEVNEKDGLTYKYKTGNIDISVPVVITKKELAKNGGKYEITLDYELVESLEAVSVKVEHHYQSRPEVTDAEGNVTLGDPADDEVVIRDIEKITVDGDEYLLYPGMIYVPISEPKSGYVFTSLNSDIEKKLEKDASKNVIKLYYMKEHTGFEIENSVEVRHVYITKIGNGDGSYTTTVSDPLIVDETKDKYKGAIGDEFTVTPKLTYQPSDAEYNYTVKFVLNADKDAQDNYKTTLKKGVNQIFIYYEYTKAYEEPANTARFKVINKYWNAILNINQDTGEIEQTISEAGTKESIPTRFFKFIRNAISTVKNEVAKVFVGDTVELEEDKDLNGENYDPVNTALSGKGVDSSDITINPNQREVTLSEENNEYTLNYAKITENLTPVEFTEKHEFYVEETNASGDLQPAAKEGEEVRKLPEVNDNLYLYQRVKTNGSYGGYVTDSVELNGNPIQESGEGYEMLTDKSLNIALTPNTTVDNGGLSATVLYKHYRKEDLRQEKLIVNYYLRELDWKGNDKTGRADLDADKFYKYGTSGESKVKFGSPYKMRPFADWEFIKGTHVASDDYTKKVEDPSKPLTVQKGDNVINVYYEKKDKYGTALNPGEGVLITHKYLRRDLAKQVADVTSRKQTKITAIEKGVWLDNEFDGTKFAMPNDNDPEFKDKYVLKTKREDATIIIKETGNEIVLEYLAEYDSTKKDDPAEKKDDESEKPKKKHKSSTSSNSNGAGTSNKGDKGTPENGGKTENTDNANKDNTDGQDTSGDADTNADNTENTSLVGEIFTIDEEEVPLASAPVIADIADTPVPLANKIVELIDEQVPLGNFPQPDAADAGDAGDKTIDKVVGTNAEKAAAKTGYGFVDMVGIGGLLALIGAILFFLILFKRRKKKEEEEEGQQ